MSRTGVQSNWGAVAYGTSAITKVTNVAVDSGIQFQYFKGDVDIYTTLAVQLTGQPSCTVTSADGYALSQIATLPATSFTATHQDTKGASGGNLVLTLSNAVVENFTGGGAHGAFGSYVRKFIGISSDGTTSPLSFSLT